MKHCDTLTPWTLAVIVIFSFWQDYRKITFNPNQFRFKRSIIVQAIILWLFYHLLRESHKMTSKPANIFSTMLCVWRNPICYNKLAIILRSEYAVKKTERGPNATSTVSGSSGVRRGFAFFLESDQTHRRVDRPLTGHVRERAGAAWPRRRHAGKRVRSSGDDGQPAGVAGLDCRRQLLVEIDLFGVDVSRHVARQPLQYHNTTVHLLLVFALCPSPLPNCSQNTRNFNPNFHLGHSSKQQTKSKHNGAYFYSGQFQKHNWPDSASNDGFENDICSNEM